MELVQIYRTLIARKRALAVAFTVALLAAISVGYSIGPSGVKSRSSSFGTAQAQILVDSPQSALANLKQNTIPLSTRAGVFAQFMASSAVRTAVAREAGIPAQRIVARGPFDDPAAAPIDAAVPPPAPPPEAPGVRRPYRLTFVAQEELPLVTVYAEAPDAGSAKRLADAVAVGVKKHVNTLQEEGQLPAKYRVVIRGLGPAQAGTVREGPNGPLMVIAFLVVFLAGCGIILFAARLKQAERRAGPSASGVAAANLEIAELHPDRKLQSSLRRSRGRNTHA